MLREPNKSVIVLEKEDRAGAHTSGRNSGVIHSGINQKPGSLKANLCVRGSALLKYFCRKSGTSFREIGHDLRAQLCRARCQANLGIGRQRMRLFEFESKRTFKAEGIPVPRRDVVSL
jgi:hypothetical protein